MKQFIFTIFSYFFHITWYKLKIIAARYYTVYRIASGAEYIFSILLMKKAIYIKNHLPQQQSLNPVLSMPL